MAPTLSCGKRKAPDNQPDNAAAEKGRGCKEFLNGTLNITPRDLYKKLIAMNAAQSPLLRLPEKLRSKIWQYALTREVIKPDSPQASSPARFSLLSTSRQIYDETAALPYALNTVWFNRTEVSISLR
ncbi:hypothetical protein CC80DRAFT_545785 [Byssothecium circinans]|uniref:Uncharacterized protein n=1 Tax=Byssothecium circinans TaxID=147558 RepID=A0A6A5U516_9PLEO|nr:hypothetical protein CC80DRAFT_545785 [Byssothecium circinans]